MPGVALNNVTTQNGYTAATTVENIPPSAKLNATIANASVYLELKQIVQGGNYWQGEVFYAPCLLAISRDDPITGFRVRSAVPGVPAQVTVNAIPG